SLMRGPRMGRAPAGRSDGPTPPRRRSRHSCWHRSRRGPKTPSQIGTVSWLRRRIDGMGETLIGRDQAGPVARPRELLRASARCPPQRGGQGRVCAKPREPIAERLHIANGYQETFTAVAHHGAGVRRGDDREAAGQRFVRYQRASLRERGKDEDVAALEYL